MERFQSPYRKELAEKLRDEPDKDARRDILRVAKATREYVGSHGLFSLNREHDRYEKEAGQIVQSAQTLDELRERVLHRPLFVTNSVRGIDHSEHLAKRIEMARRFKDSDLLPEAAGFRDKVKTFLQAQEGGSESVIGIKEYAKYLGEHCSKFNITEDELVRAAEKLPPDTFGSIDAELEPAVILLNSIPGAKTNFSCAGHTDYASAGIESSTVQRAYFSFSSKDQALIEQLKSLPYPFQETDSGYVVNFSKNIPPKDWITKRGLRTPEEIFEDSKKQLALILGNELLTCDARSFWDMIIPLQEKYIASQPDAVTVPYATNSKTLEPIHKLLPEMVENREYRDYYVSPEAEKLRTDFINRLTRVIDIHRLSLRKTPRPGGTM